MATKQQCAAALDQLRERLNQVDEQIRRRHAVDRTLRCYLPDLAVTFSGQLVDGRLAGLTEGAAGHPQICFTLTSDDLLALSAGELGLGTAWASRRLRVEATLLDLLRLGSWV